MPTPLPLTPVDDFVSVLNQVPGPAELDEDGLSRALLVCLDGETCIYPHYYTRSGRWIQAGRHGDAPNVTHYRDYPASPGRS